MNRIDSKAPWAARYFAVSGADNDLLARSAVNRRILRNSITSLVRKDCQLAMALDDSVGTSPSLTRRRALRLGRQATIEPQCHVHVVDRKFTAEYEAAAIDFFPDA